MVNCASGVFLANFILTAGQVITQQLIQVFNGQFVEGVGTMIFNKKRSARCKAFESGLKPYKGKILLFANNCLS